jgi:hypothetical protein
VKVVARGELPLIWLLAVLQAATAASVITVTTTGICRFFMK